ncbi:hypothetical protein MKK65_29570 [Methylobacterium sp. J-001]|uniref:hypothetical protein n=1 Tax=Methylobacterium sp. J-001 TaxID=2836609 RepID=UPI001FBB9AFE|nr:hypothetical protein [Methylobacterium sp. J-001]MCJ2120658.1 hypothetical protein [Methylobacterium sp. J-001]
MAGLTRRKARGEAVADEQSASLIEGLRTARAQADAERIDAVRMRVDAEDRRHAALKAEDETALARIDDELSTVRRRIDIAEAKFARLDGELAQAEHDAEQGRRHAVMAEAMRALDQAREVMRNEYPAAALAVVDVLRRVRAFQEIARQANLELPDDAAPLSLIVDPLFTPEAAPMPTPMMWGQALFHKETGKRAPISIHSGPDYELREVLVPRPLADVHAPTFMPIADFVNLPGVEPGKYFYGAVRWGQPRN